MHLPRDLKEIPNGLFYECSRLRKVTLHEGLTNIGGFAFGNCKNLENIEIPSTVIQLGERAFEKNINLKAVTFHEGLQNIRQFAFSGCSTIKSIQLPNSVTSIEKYAFSTCTSLSDVTLPQNLTEINNYTFYNCPIDSITIPKSIKKIGEKAFSKVNTVKIHCTTPPEGYIECKKLYIPKGTHQQYISSQWATYTSEIIEMDE